jgi:hypothetical protein
MVRIIAVFLFSGFLCISSGCNRQNKTSPPPQTESKASLEQGSFPAFLVGTWKAEDSNQYNWEFTFEKDGTISSLRNFMDIYIKVSEGGTYEQAADANVDSASTLGPVEVGFDPNSRILTVKVMTDYFMLHIYDEIAEGNSIDTIFGPVSEDGKTWTTEWRGVSRLFDGSPMDFNNPSISSVVFHKVKNEDGRPSKGNR